jgi:phosphatidylserine/phosphatidylglycerophosphate/cardiolipin synthase-like enzyme
MEINSHNHNIVVLTQNYFRFVISNIYRAKSSIYMTAYLFNFYPNRPSHKATRIFNALVTKHKEGLDIKILLDSPPANRPNHLPNGFSYRRFRDNNIEVKMLASKQSLHKKIFIIDEALVITGSHNISNPSLTSTSELSIASSNYEFVKRITDDFLKTWTLNAVPWRRWT